MSFVVRARGEGRTDGNAPPATVGADAEQTSCVADVHDVVAHGWPETYAEGLASTAPKPKPRMLTAAPREAGAFSGEKPVAAKQEPLENDGLMPWKIAPHAS